MTPSLAPWSAPPIHITSYHDQFSSFISAPKMCKVSFSLRFRSQATGIKALLGRRCKGTPALIFSWVHKPHTSEVLLTGENSFTVLIDIPTMPNRNGEFLLEGNWFGSPLFTPSSTPVLKRFLTSSSGNTRSSFTGIIRSTSCAVVGGKQNKQQMPSGWTY